MAKKSIWTDDATVAEALRQIAVNNGIPNVMPTFEQMLPMPGLASWVKKKGGAKRWAQKLNMLMKPSVMPNIHSGVVFPKQVIIGSTVYVHNNRHVFPAIVLEKGSAGALVVLVLNKKLTRKHVKFGHNRSTKYQWCSAKDVPKELITINL